MAIFNSYVSLPEGNPKPLPSCMLELLSLALQADQLYADHVVHGNENAFLSHCAGGVGCGAALHHGNAIWDKEPQELHLHLLYIIWVCLKVADTYPNMWQCSWENEVLNNCSQTKVPGWTWRSLFWENSIMSYQSCTFAICCLLCWLMTALIRNLQAHLEKLACQSWSSWARGLLSPYASCEHGKCKARKRSCSVDFF